jgi:tetratricopeptide (TPR) repeat protein
MIKKRALAAIVAGILLAVFFIALKMTASAISDKRKEVVLLKTALEEKNVKLNHMENQITRLSSDKISLSKKKQDLKNRFSSVEQEISSLKQKEANLSRELEILLDKKKGLEDTLNEAVISMQEKIWLEKKETEQETVIAQQEYLAQKKNLSAQIEFLEENLENLRNEKHVLAVTADDAAARLERERTKLDSYKQALVHESEKIYQAAIEEYEKILSLDPRDAGAHIRLASLYEYHVKNPEKAKYHIGEYYALKGPELGSLPEGTGARRAGQSEKKTGFFTRSSKPAQGLSGIPGPERFAQDIFDQEEYDRTREEEFRHYYNLALQYDNEGMYSESVQEYKKALELMPNDADLHYNLAVIYDDHIQDKEKAIFHYQRYLRLNPAADDIKAVTIWINRAKEDLKWQRRMR